MRNDRLIERHWNRLLELTCTISTAKNFRAAKRDTTCLIERWLNEDEDSGNSQKCECGHRRSSHRDNIANGDGCCHAAGCNCIMFTRSLAESPRILIRGVVTRDKSDYRQTKPRRK
jgi:hypothetical protein